MVHVSSGWKKVNLTNMANNLKVSLDKFMDCSDIKTPINNLWSDFKTICLDNLRKHVPSKHVKNRSRVLTALVAKFTTCSHPASNIVFMMVLLVGIVY
jgi:hypothetical protein